MESEYLESEDNRISTKSIDVEHSRELEIEYIENYLNIKILMLNKFTQAREISMEIRYSHNNIINL